MPAPDFAIGQLDRTGATIRTVYYLSPGRFAIYATDAGLVVEHADEPALAARQRAALAGLNILRGEIDCLVARAGRRAHADRRRLADALNIALLGGRDDAAALLAQLRADLLADRGSAARLLYVAVAGVVTFVSAATAAFVDMGDTGSLAAAGAVGALFSIALAVRGRAIDLAPHIRDTIADSVLRIFIGIVSALVLTAFLASTGLGITLGETVLGARCDGMCDMPLLLAFSAGFAERLVGNLVERRIVLPLDTGVSDGCLTAQLAGDGTSDRDLPAATGGVAP